MLNLAYESSKEKKPVKPKPKAQPKGPKLPAFLEQKAVNRSTAAETGISSDSPLLKAFRQTLAPKPAAPKGVPTEDQKFKAFQQGIGVKNPPRRPTVTEVRKNKPGTVEFVMSQLDKDKRLNLSPEDRELAAKVLRFRAMRPMGDDQFDPEIRVNAFDPANIEGRVRNEDVIDVLRLLRNKKSLLVAELDGHRAQREALSGQVAAQRANPGPALVASQGFGALGRDDRRVDIDAKGQMTPYDSSNETHLGILAKNLERNTQLLNEDIYRNPIGKFILDSENKVFDASQVGQMFGFAASAGEILSKWKGADLRKAMETSGAPGLQDLAPLMDQNAIGSLKKLKEEFIKSTPGMALSFVPDTLLKAGMTVDTDPRMTGQKRFWAGLETAMNLLGSEMVIGAIKAGKGVAMLHRVEQILDSGGTIGEDVVRSLEHELGSPGILGDLEKVPEPRKTQRMSPEEIKSILGEDADSAFLSDFESRYLAANPGATAQDAREAYAWSVKHQRESSQFSDATVELIRDSKKQKNEAATVEPQVLQDKILTEAQAEAPAPKMTRTTETDIKPERLGDGSQMMDPHEIGVHDGIQYKRKTDNKDKVTARFKNIKNFDVDQAGEITVWRRTDGSLYVAHGHHRLELAKRAERFVQKGPNGELVDVPRQIKVRILDEAGDATGANAWDLNAVRLHAAWENLQNGDGSALDGLMVLKEMGKTPDDFAEMGTSTGKALSRDIDGLMKLNDDAIRFVQNDQISESAAAGVGDSGILPKYQAKAIAKLVENGGQQSYEDAKGFARIFGDNAKRSEGRVKSDQISLGGMEDWAEVVDTVSEESKLELRVKREMLDEFSSMKKGLSLETLPTETIDTKGRQIAIAAMGDTRGRLKWATDKAFENWEPLQEMRYDLALKVKNGEITESEAARQLKRYLFDEISKKPPISDYVVGRRLAEAEADGAGVVGNSEKLLSGQTEEVIPEKPADGALFEEPQDPVVPDKPAKNETPKTSPLDETVKGASDLSERDQAVIKSLGPVKVESREDFVRGLKEHFNLSDDEIAAGMAVQDARAKGWAVETGNKAEDWYATHWEAITTSPGKTESAFQDNKGFIQFKKDGKAVLAAMKKPDVSTFLHEVGHLFRRQIPEEAMKFLEDYYKLSDGKWTVEAEEDFARQFERWLYDGRVAHKKLESVFVKLRDWFRNIYTSLAGSPIEKQLNPRLRDIFERLTNEKGFYADYDPTLGVKPSTSRKGGTSIVFDNKQWELSAQEHLDFKALRAKQKTDFERLKAQLAVAESDDPIMSRMIAADLKELEKAHKDALNAFLDRTENFQKQVDALMRKDLDGRAPGFRLDDGGEIEAPDKEMLFQRQLDPKAKAEILGWIKQVLAENGGDGLGAVRYFKAQGLMESEAVSLVMEAGGRIKAGLGLENKTMALDLLDEGGDQGTLFQRASSEQIRVSKNIDGKQRWATSGYLGEASGQIKELPNGRKELVLSWISSPHAPNPKSDYPKFIVAQRSNGFENFGNRLFGHIIKSELKPGDVISGFAPSFTSEPLFKKFERDGFLKSIGKEYSTVRYEVIKVPEKLETVKLPKPKRGSELDNAQYKETLFQAGDHVPREMAEAGYEKPLTIQEEREITGKAAILKAKLDAAFAFVGSPTDQIRAVGKVGSPNRAAATQIADDIERITNNTLKWEYRLSKDIDDTAAKSKPYLKIGDKEVGAKWKQIDAELEQMARKIFRGEVDQITGETEKAVYEKWVKINGGLIGSAEANDVVIDVPVYKIARPERMAEEWPGVSQVEHEAMKSGDFWKSQDIRWYGEDDNGSKVTLSGKIVSIEKDGIWVKANNKTAKEFLGTSRKVSRYSQVAPENYFPRVLKDSVIEELQDQSGPAWDWVNERMAAYVTDGDEDLAARLQSASESVARKARAEQQARIDRAVQEFLHPAEMGNAVTAGPSRVEWERLPMAYPEDFYDFDFRKIAKRHINAAVTRIQEAAVWGHDGEDLNVLLSKVGREAGAVLDKVHMALGRSESRFKFEKAVRTAISVEGAWQAATKLTALTSTIKQIPQLGSTIGVLGFKNGLKAMRLGGMWDAKIRSEIAEIIRSGVSAEAMSYLHMEDMSGAARKVADAAVTVGGLKPADNALRILSAAAGKDAVLDAVKRLQVVDGVIQRYKDLKIVEKLRAKGVNSKYLPPSLRDPNYSLLRDWFHYTDEDIIEMVQTGKLTPSQRDMAYQGGAKTQVRTRAGDIPSLMQRNPMMRIFTRFRTFQYGQAKILTYALNEATRGNVAPLARMVLGYATLGYLSDRAVREVKAWMENKAPKKDYDTIEANLTWGMINGGLGGIFLEPLNSGENKIMDEDADPGDKAKALAGGVKNLTLPPILGDLANVAGGVAAMDDYNTKNPLIGLDDFLRNSVVLYGRMAKRREPDEAEIKRIRAEVKKQLQKEGYDNSYIESFLEKRYQLPAPRWASDKFKSWQKDLRDGIDLSRDENGKLVKSKSSLLDDMIDRPDPYDRPKKK